MRWGPLRRNANAARCMKEDARRFFRRGQVRSLSGIYSCMRQCLSSTYCGPGTGNVALNDIVEDSCPRGSRVLEGQKDLK